MMKEISVIIEECKTKEEWSRDGKYNYGPIEHLAKSIFSDGTDEAHFKLYYDNLRNVTDAETFFVDEFRRFDIYVDCDQLLYVMSKAFPEVEKATIFGWIKEHEQSHHVLR